MWSVVVPDRCLGPCGGVSVLTVEAAPLGRVGGPALCAQHLAPVGYPCVRGRAARHGECVSQDTRPVCALTSRPGTLLSVPWVCAPTMCGGRGRCVSARRGRLPCTCHIGALTRCLSVNGFSPESGQVFFGITACLSQVSVLLVAVPRGHVWPGSGLLAHLCQRSRLPR